MVDKNEIRVPKHLGIRPTGFEPLLLKWKERNPCIDWTVLVKRGLLRELEGIAGKRHAKLVEQLKQEVAA